MEALINNAINEFQLDKRQWSLTKFGDIAVQQKKSVDRDDTELTRYVKGEHMGSEDLHLREWGELTDEYLGPAFIRKFEEGDILYGSRRTYLRKVVIAPFDGITSNTTFVIKANEKRIDKRLLPFIMMSERFTDNSIKNSKGSVNPYINWKDIAKYEFLLPPRNQQDQLAEILWAIDEVIERERVALGKIRFLKDSTVQSKCLNVKGSNRQLNEIIDYLEAGVSVNSEEGIVQEGEYGILKTSSVSSGYFIPTEVKRVVLTEYDRLKASVRQNSIIISRMNTVELVGANAYVEKNCENFFLPDRLWQTHISSSDVNVKFLWFVLSSPAYRSKISDLCTGTSNSMKNISQKSFLGIDVILPSRENQNKIVKEIDQISESSDLFETNIARSKVLQKSLINQIF